MGRREQALVLVCFLLSGVAALVYQIAWTRQFSFVFGTSQLAVATVLAAYMGGLASGAAAAGRLAPRLRRPVLAYGCLELGIAAAAIFAVPAGIRAARALHAAWLGGSDALPGEGGAAAALFYAACAFAILWLPTALMGATLPLLARHAVRDEREIGSKVGLLYATNTAGAVAGALAAGFLLLPRFGLGRTLWIAASLNALVFVAAALLVRGSTSPQGAAPRESVPPPDFAGRELVLPLMTLSGAASFSYEVLWSRLLGLVLGGSVPAFATMLASFLVGIALGAALGARLASSPRRSAFALGVAQLATATFSVLAFVLLDRLPFGGRGILPGITSRLATDAALAAAVLLPSTLSIGATFPLAVRVLARGAEQAGLASARVYAWNTLGAIAGAIGAGFFAIPALGFEGVLASTAALNLLLALAAGALVPDARRGLRAGAAALVAAGLAALVLARPGPPWRVLRSSPLGAVSAGGSIVHLGVGRSATVLLLERSGAFELRSDGLQESIIQPPGGRAAQFASARWLGALPTLARPDARSLLVVGLGGGTALEEVPASVTSIDVVELEPEVIRANRAVAASRRRDPLADPRLHLVVNDARSALLLTRRRWDAIVSQPSHPWTLGASHLYTREFFELAREHLTEDGVLVQWMGLAFVDAPLLRSLVATLADVFAHVEVYRPEPAALLFLASQRPFDAEASARRAIASAPDAFAELGLFGAEDVLAARALDAEGARRFAAGAAQSTDDRNLLLLRGLSEPRLLDPQPLFERFDPLAGPSPGLDRVYLVRRLLALGLRTRAGLVARTSADPAQRETALGLVALASADPEGGRARLDRALALDPGAEEARFALLRMRRRAWLAGEPGTLALAATLDGTAAAVLAGWTREQRGDWAGVEALEPALASAAPLAPWREDAARLRIGWRMARGGAERAGDALAIADELVALTGSIDDLLLRAELATRSGRSAAAFHTLHQTALNLRPTPMGRARARRALAILDSLSSDESLREDRELLVARLRELAR